MKVFLNHRPIEKAEAELSLTALLEEEGLARAGVAVAINNKVVPRKDWDTTPLHDGVKITVIHAVCGG
ncbi:MAG: sulfur carrier protein ThiS [Duncaniella sp.]|nr:sulfur carrier protein ThiS [Duncaniella sp.]